VTAVEEAKGELYRTYVYMHFMCSSPLHRDQHADFGTRKPAATLSPSRSEPVFFAPRDIRNLVLCFGPGLSTVLSLPKYLLHYSQIEAGTTFAAPLLTYVPSSPISRFHHCLGASIRSAT